MKMQAAGASVTVQFPFFITKRSNKTRLSGTTKIKEIHLACVGADNYSAIFY